MSPLRCGDSAVTVFFVRSTDQRGQHNLHQCALVTMRSVAMVNKYLVVLVVTLCIATNNVGQVR